MKRCSYNTPQANCDVSQSMLAGQRYNIVSILWWHVTHLAAQITAKSAPKIAKCAFPKRETYNSSNLLLYKKDKKDNDHAKKYKVWFLNSQSMVFKFAKYGFQDRNL